MATIPSETSIDQEYRTRLEARRRTLAERDRAHLRLSHVRIAIAASAGAILVFGGLQAAPWLVLPLAAFVVAAIVHVRLLDARDRARSAVAFYERGIARRSHAWMGQGSQGDRFRQPDHPYADDLDLFGHGSLFELLATTRTRAGEDVLASWLLRPASPDEILARQEAVEELKPRLDLRESLAVLGDGLRVGVDATSLRAWATAPRRLGQPVTRLALLVFSAVTGALLLWWLFGADPPLRVVQAAIVFAAIEGGIALWFRSAVHTVIHAVDPASRDLELLAGLLKTIERERFSSPRLAAFHDALEHAGRRASAEISYLAQLVALLRSRQNVMFALPAALVLWATQVSHAIEAWRRRVGPDVPRWLDVVGEFEALAAIATFAAENPGYAVPEVRPADAAHLAGEAVAHPLLPATAVANDIAFGRGAPELYIVSGSNMSGKSTFLRALGLNVVLAEMGAPVRARSFRLSPLAVGAAIRIQDSLQDGRSRFFAEITRLKQIVDLATAHPNGALFLLDEILAGTNSHDRRHGADALVTGLINLGAIGLATTHDLALGEIADRLLARAANVHFEDSFAGGVLTFDYRLREGIVRTSNAIPLMRSIGLDV